MRKFFVPPGNIKDNTAVISGEEMRHIVNVLRLTRGDKLVLFDGTGNIYESLIAQIGSKKIQADIKKIYSQDDSLAVAVTLVQALPKKRKIEHIIEKCTELGVKAVIPVYTSRTVVKVAKTQVEKRRQRWQRIAKEAAKQCGRAHVPCVEELVSWHDVFSRAKDFDLKLLPCLDAQTKKMKSVLREHKSAKNALVCIGPEGGFTLSELNQALGAGFIPVSLGENILKTDTAAVAVMVMLHYEFNL